MTAVRFWLSGMQLEKMDKVVTYAIKKGVPPALSFLPNSDKIQDDIEHQDFDLLITFGCSSNTVAAAKE